MFFQHKKKMMQKKSTFFFINDLSTLYTSQFFRILSFFEMSKAVVAVGTAAEAVGTAAEAVVPAKRLFFYPDGRELVVVLDGRSITCMCDGDCDDGCNGDCKGNVRYSCLNNGWSRCHKCTPAIVCSMCKKHARGYLCATGLYKGLCIDCTRCENCGDAMYDQVCRCLL